MHCKLLIRNYNYSRIRFFFRLQDPDPGLNRPDPKHRFFMYWNWPRDSSVSHLWLYVKCRSIWLLETLGCIVRWRPYAKLQNNGHLMLWCVPHLMCRAKNSFNSIIAAKIPKKNAEIFAKTDFILILFYGNRIKLRIQVFSSISDPDSGCVRIRYFIPDPDP